MAQNPDEVFVYDNSIYEPKSPWVTIAIGPGYNLNHKSTELTGSLIYHMDYSFLSFMAGYHLNKSESFLTRTYQTMTNFSLAPGFRIENLKYNIAFYAGPDFAYGQTLVSENMARVFRTAGSMLNIEFTYKLFYDVGVGISLFGSFTKYYNIAGIQLHAYFSGAYKTGFHKPKIN